MNAVDLLLNNQDNNPDWDSGTAELGHLLKPGELDLSHKVILYLEDITVSFDGFRALNKLSLAIDAGELRCIIGPNGAGKTTMMDVITGKTRPAVCPVDCCIKDEDNVEQEAELLEKKASLHL